MAYDELDPAYDDTFDTEPKRRGVSFRWLILGFLGVLLTLCLLCGGGAYVLFWMGDDLFAEQVAADLQTNEVLADHLGTIQSMEVDWGASMSNPDPDEYVFEVQGTKGSGRLIATCITIDMDTEQVTEGVLELDSGESYDLFPGD